MFDFVFSLVSEADVIMNGLRWADTVFLGSANYSVPTASVTSSMDLQDWLKGQGIPVRGFSMLRGGTDIVFCVPRRYKAEAEELMTMGNVPWSGK